MPTLTLIRGLPGSGKSTLAGLLASSESNDRLCLHFEADNYFIDKDGVYKYDRTKIADAHNLCFNHTKTALFSGYGVVVSNTFTQIWQMEPYLNLCHENGYKLNVIECKGQFGNIHNVPDEALKRFRDTWEEFPCQ